MRHRGQYRRQHGYNCKTIVSPSKSTARGILEVRDSSQRTLQNVELAPT